MSTNFPFFLSEAAGELEKLRGKWGWFVGLGGALILVGLLAISYPVAATITTMELFGFLLLIGGGFEIASAIWTRGWEGLFLHLLCGLLYVFVGVVLIERPLLGAEVYTLLLAVFFVASGLFRAFVSASQRFSGWGWVLLSGAVSFLLGVMIWRQLPGSGLWVVGLFVGLDLLFNGWAWVMLGLALRRVPATSAATGAAPTEPAKS